MPHILFVDDEQGVLKAVERLFRQADKEVLTALSGAEALKLFDEFEIAVLVSDQRMPEMLGTELVERVKVLSPNTVRIILSGYTDLRYLLEAINNGEIFRFITKPWDDDELISFVEMALEQYQQNMNFNSQEEQVLLALAQTIELKDPYTRGHCDRVAKLAMELAKRVGLEEGVIRSICHGSWLHDCGKIGVHEDILNFPGPISGDQVVQIKKHPNSGALIAQKANLPETVVNVIRYHHERIDGQGYPDGLSGEEIPIEAKIVAVADVYDSLATDRPYRKACSPEKIEKIMSEFRGCALDEELLDILMNEIVPESEK